MDYNPFVTSSRNKDSTAASIAPLPKAKVGHSFRLGPLTPQEIDSLRRDKRRVSAEAGALLGRLHPERLKKRD